MPPNNPQSTILFMAAFLLRKKSPRRSHELPDPDEDWEMKLCEEITLFRDGTIKKSKFKLVKTPQGVAKQPISHRLIPSDSYYSSDDRSKEREQNMALRRQLSGKLGKL